MTFFFYSFIVNILLSLLFLTEWKNNLLAAFSMHPTTSTTRTCRGGGGREKGGAGSEGKEREF